jgi:hypothetical protein
MGSNIGMDIKETEWQGVDRICLALDKDQWWVLVNKVMNCRVP